MPYPASVQVAPTATFIFSRKPNPVHAASFILSDFSANSPLHHPCKRRQYRRYRNRALRICEQAPPAKHIYPDGGLSLCSAQASLPDADPPCSFFCPQAVSKVCYSLCSRQHPFALLFYGFCFRFVLPTFRHLFISGLVLCFSIEQNSRIQLHFGPPKDSAFAQKSRFCLCRFKRMRIFSAFFLEQPLNLIDNRKILFR